jgi:hypothetical protein
LKGGVEGMGKSRRWGCVILTLHYLTLILHQDILSETYVYEIHIYETHMHESHTLCVFV